MKALKTYKTHKTSQFKSAANRSKNAGSYLNDFRSLTVQRKPNNTGLPNQLKSGIENLSGYSMDDVKVHYNSSKPAQLNAHAYAQGSQIHVASGQERHLAHEAWHVVQQKQGRVKATNQLKKNLNVNDDSHLEAEADKMGARALQMKSYSPKQFRRSNQSKVFQFALATDDNLEGIKDARGYYRWAGLRTNPVEGDASITGEGLGSPQDGLGPNLKTQITWAKPSAETGGEGVRMTADPLGPDHKLGSPPGSKGIWATRRKDFTQLSGHAYIAGHLLNNNLGGPGNLAANLTAIPSSANAEHSAKIEEPIKHEVNVEHKWIKYQVDVSYGDLDGVDPASLGYTGINPTAIKAKAISDGKYESGAGDNINIKYANRLTGTWQAIKADGSATGSVKSRQININPPTDGTSHNATGNTDEEIAARPLDQSKTTIGHENLVLTNTDHLRAAHMARRPLVEHHENYEDNAVAEIDRLNAENARLSHENLMMRQFLRTIGMQLIATIPKNADDGKMRE